MRIRRVLVLLLLLMLTASLATAQFGRRRSYRAAFATPTDFDGGFQFCRLVTRESPQGDGAGWNVDYPRADINLSIRLAELTKTPVSMDDAHEPKTLLVNLGSPELFHCGFLMMTEPGAAYFTPEDAVTLRKYLQQGGFLWADDYWGEYAWDYFEAQLRQALPSSNYPIIDLPRSHPIFLQTLDATQVPQIPGIGYWDGGSRTWERSPRENVPHIRAINDEHGRVMVLLTHDTDFGDAYERETENPQYFMKFSVPGYAFGINVITYAMTH